LYDGRDLARAPVAHPTFRYGIRGTGRTTWVSTESPGAHYLAARLDRPYELSSLQLLQTPADRGPVARVDAMEVWLTGAQGWHQVWRGDALGESAVISAAWPAEVTTDVAVVVRASVVGRIRVAYAQIEELVFPGYFAVFDWPDRPADSPASVPHFASVWGTEVSAAAGE
jgi:hypothetical protein